MTRKKSYNRFIAIDFETANTETASACALGIAVVENLSITEEFYTLIKPPMDYFRFTDIHGITWDDVKNEMTFDELWPGIQKYFEHIDFVAGHNIGFDRTILKGCCSHYNINIPDVKYECTWQLSRKRLKLKSNALDKVSAYFGIELNHHNALSDAKACAKIMINFLAPNDAVLCF
ncbi:MAG: 3'-5' exonuclease [Spirochaetes bacterium]|nr:3'-5' exonuclease [Spirochaetota bacterium]